jgi:hypothetical protein
VDVKLLRLRFVILHGDLLIHCMTYEAPEDIPGARHRIGLVDVYTSMISFAYWQLYTSLVLRLITLVLHSSYVK